MNRSWVSLVLIVSAGLLSGCGEFGDDSMDTDEGSLSEARLALTLQNGHEMNGTAINGNILNGTKNNGTKNNGTKNNGTSLEGTDEDTGLVVSGMAMLGLTMPGVLGTNVEINLYIDEVRGSELSNGMYTYVFRKDNHSGENVCLNDASAIPLNGRWNYATGEFVDDPNFLTIACRGAALAKCIESGYRRDGTWNDGGTTRNNRDLHEACVRMIRADYCGNGVATTMNGTLVDIFDKKETQTRSSDISLKLEAEWGPDGAHCINHTRWDTSAVGDVSAYLAANCSSRNVACGTGFGTGVLRNASGQNDHSTSAFNGWTW